MIEEIACSEKVTLVFDKKTEAALTNVSFSVKVGEGFALVGGIRERQDLFAETPSWPHRTD